MDEHDLINVPIPSAMPDRPDLSQIPDHILRSSAVETLIAQNDDLMARLSVSLRRNAGLEDAQANLEKTNRILTHKLDILNDQILVLKEKDAVALGRYQDIDKQIAKYKEQIRTLEIRYAELHTQSKERTQVFLERVEALSKRIRNFLKFRSRVHTAAKARKKNLSRVQEELRFTQKILHRDQGLLQDLKEKLNLATYHIQDLRKEHEHNARVLVEQYEEKLKVSESQKAELKNECAELKARTSDYERLYNDNITLQNKWVFEKRAADEIKTKYDMEIQKLQSELSQYRTQYKSEKITSERMADKLKHSNAQLDQAQQEQARLSDQVESLQVLWQESQTSLEKEKGKTESLQRLNQQLSTSLNQYRKQVERLSRASEAKAFIEEIKPKAQPSIAAEPSLKADLETPSLSPGRMDELIAEIHGRER